MYIYVEPGLIGYENQLTITVQGAGSGLQFNQFSGVEAKIAATNGPQLTVVLDENGRAIQKIGASQYPGGSQISAYRINDPLVVSSVDFQQGRWGYLVKVLDDMFCAFRDIPRYEEPGMISENGKFAQFGWGGWQSDPEPTIMKNTDVWLSNEWLYGSGYLTDYEKGRVYFQSPLQGGEDIRASYSFRLIPLAQYRSFLDISLSIINGKKPQSFFGINDYPDQWLGLIVLGAYEQAAKCLLTKMQMFRFRRLFEDPDRITSELRQNATDARAEFEVMLPQIKRRGSVSPLAIGTWNQNIPAATDNVNYKQFTILR